MIAQVSKAADLPAPVASPPALSDDALKQMVQQSVPLPSLGFAAAAANTADAAADAPTDLPGAIVFYPVAQGGGAHSPRYTTAELETLKRLSSTSADAALLFLNSNIAADADLRDRATTTALSGSGGENGIAWAHVGWQSPAALVSRAAAVRALAKRYPRNYLFARSLVILARSQGDAVTEQRAAVAEMLDAPRDPDACLSTGYTVGDAADVIRRGKVSAALTPTEEEFLTYAYHAWDSALQRATELDPLYARAWQRLSMAATFYGDREQAARASNKARELSSDPYDVYAWGLLMFGPNWGGRPSDLRDVAESAADATYATGYEVNTWATCCTTPNSRIWPIVCATAMSRRRRLP